LKNRAGRYKLISIYKLTGLLLFLFALMWFYYPGEYVLVANQDLTLFITTPGYLLSFLDRPGGLIEYLGSLLSQFFRFRLAGAVVLSVVIATGYFAAGSLFTRVSGKKGSLIAGVLASVLLMGMHNFYPHQVSHSLGFILAIAMAAISPSDRSRRRVFLAIAVPVIYLVSGGFVWFFCGLVLAGNILGRDKTDVISVLLSILYPALIITLGARFLYLYSLKELIGAQLPFGSQYGYSLWPYLFVGWMFLMILLVRVPVRVQNLNRILKMASGIALCGVGMVMVLHFSYNRRNAEFFAIEKMAIGEEWDQLLKYTAEHPSTNLFGSFYTNLALVNKGMLCEALFQYPQGFGRRGLCFEWEEKSEILRRGSDFFWTIHFVNEAHHWAFESLITDGFTRRNLKRLIQTELVRGNFKVAEKYIDYLGGALFQKKMADHYSVFLYNRGAIENDPELGPRLNTQIKDDFFSEGADLEENLRSVLANNPSNRPALDYLMALYLLEKEVDKIALFLPGYLETHNGRLPTLLDESLLVFQITHREDPLSDIKVSPATIQRFDEYTRILRQNRNRDEAARMLYPTYKYSFWFHLNFNSLPNR
jgi:hypothetical protein